MMDFCFPASSAGQVYEKENERIAVAQCRQVKKKGVTL